MSRSNIDKGQLIHSKETNIAYTFTASDSAANHGHNWVNGFAPLIVGAILCLFGGEALAGIILIAIGVIIIIIFGSLRLSGVCDCHVTMHEIVFKPSECIIQIYCNDHLKYSVQYSEFSRLKFEYKTEKYFFFCFMWCWMRWGYRCYQGGLVYILLKNGRKKYINDRLCWGAKEEKNAVSMVQAVNTYFLVDRKRLILIDPNETSNNDVLISTEIKPETNSRIRIGTACYVDCESVYGIVIAQLPNNFYKIIDLFEQRERSAYETSLRTITDKTVLGAVNEQYQNYFRKLKEHLNEGEELECTTILRSKLAYNVNGQIQNYFMNGN